MIKPGFGTRIKRARELNFLTRKQLAESLGITQHTIRYFEEQERRPKWNVLVRLAQTLKTTELYLIAGKNNLRPTHDNDQLHKAYTMIRMLVTNKKELEKLHKSMLKFLSARFRFD